MSSNSLQKCWSEEGRLFSQARTAIKHTNLCWLAFSNKDINSPSVSIGFWKTLMFWEMWNFQHVTSVRQGSNNLSPRWDSNQWLPICPSGALNRATETLSQPGHLLGLTYTGLLIFRAVAEPRISSKSTKSHEIHKTRKILQNWPWKFSWNLPFFPQICP